MEESGTFVATSTPPLKITGNAKMAIIPICPAVIFAPSLIVRAKGLTKMPIISIGININSTINLRLLYT